MRMKKFFTLCALLFFIQSCTKGVVVDESTASDQTNKSKIQLNFKALASERVETDDSGPDYFNFLGTDRIGLFLLKSPSTLTDSRYCDNELFLCDDEGTITSNPPFYYPTSGDACSVLAYYPYQENMIPNKNVKHHFKLPTNQKDIELHDIDFMVSQKDGVTPSDESVSLTFKHRLARMSIVLEPSEHYNATQLLEYNPQISFHRIFSEADYDFMSERFIKPIQAEKIIPNGEWKVDDQGNLIGKSCLLLPESIITGSSYVELIFNGTTYRMIICDEDLSSLPNGKLESGSNIKCVFKTKSSDIVGGILKATFKVDVGDWPSPVIKEIGLEDASQKYCYIKIADIDFSKTQIYHIFNKSKSLYEISRQVVVVDDKSQVNIVLIPLDEDGEIIYEDKVTLWEGDNHRTEYLFFDKSWKYSYTETTESTQVGLEKVNFFDVRMGVTIPLFRVAEQIWFGADYKVDYMANSIPLKLTNNFLDCQTIPAYHKINVGGDVNYVYNKIAIMDPNFVPKGYHLPSLAECITLKAVYGDNLGTLVSANGWDDNADVSSSSFIFFNPNTSYALESDINSASVATYWSLSLNEVAYFTFDFFVDKQWSMRHYTEAAVIKKIDFSFTDAGFAVRLIKD